MPKIPCPSCQEPNFDTAPLCWKCGASLRKPVQSAPEPPEPEKPAEPVAPDPVPEEVPQITGGQKAVMDIIIDIETAEVSFKKNLLYAIVFGGLFGMLAGLLACIPFTMWVKASYLPASKATFFLIWSALSGCAAGAIAGFSRYGVVGGAAIYAGLITLVQLFAAVSTTFAGRAALGYHQFTGFFIAYAAQSAALLTLKLMGRTIVLPSRAPESPINRKRGLMMMLTVGLAILCVISLSRYSKATHEAKNDPARAVAGYCWELARGGNGNINAIAPRLTTAFAARAAQNPAIAKTLHPSSKLPTSRSLKAISTGKDKPNVRFLPSGMAARVLLANSDEAWVPDPWKAPGDNSSLSQIAFQTTLENGKWRISAPPVIFVPESD